MNFLDPNRLWLLATVGALAAAYVLVQFRRTRYAVRFTNLALLDRIAPARPRWRRHVPAALFLILLALLVVGYARPTAEQRVARERATVIVAIDVSGSMAAEDVPPTRLDAALDAAQVFVDGLPERFRVGVVAFAGSASVVMAPGTDRAAVRSGIQRMSSGQFGRQGTSIGEAIATAVEAIRTSDPEAAQDPPPARIVILSDGNNTAGRDPMDAAELAAQEGIPVDSIAFGTPDGVIQRGGRLIAVPMVGETLRGVADQTGGDYHEAGTAEELRAVYADIGSSIGYRIEVVDVSARFIGFGLLIAFAVAAASLAWFSRLP